jgi:branched-chain amino acid transport system substrate-binding protein
MRKHPRQSGPRRYGAALVTGVTVLALTLGAGIGGTATAADSDTTTTTVPAGGWPKVDQPGVSDTEIRVGGVTSTTNATQGKYVTAYDGVKAYFAMVNKAGGIYGRKLKLASERDDQMLRNKQEVQALIDQDNVFAVLPVANIAGFTGAEVLQQQGIPAFGINYNEEWSNKDAMFGDRGSLCFDCAGVALPWVAKKLGKKNVAILAYAVPQSKGCADGIENSFKKYTNGAKVAFVDSALSFGNVDFSVQVDKMKQAGVDFVTTCMDTNAVFNLAKEMRKQRLDATQYLPDGYDPEFIKKNAKLFTDSVVLTIFTPPGTKPAPPGLKNFEKWIKKTGGAVTSNSITGWINADQFVTGLKLAGPEFTRQKVIDGINNGPDFTADGMVSPVDWSTAHTESDPPLGCPGAYTQITSSGTFKPIFTKDGKSFPCFNRDVTKIPKNPVEYQG